MYAEIDSYQEGWGGDALEADVRRLAEETTEVGLAVEETFKNAASALYDLDASVAFTLMESSEARAADGPIHAKIVDILRHETLSGDQMRHLAELQQIAAGFARIGEQARAIGGYALALRGAVETELKFLAPDIYRLLIALIRQTYGELRGSIMVTNARDTVTARRLLTEDAKLDQIYLDCRRAVQQAISANPHRAVLLQQVLLVGGRMEEIGNQVAEICRAVLHAPPAAKVTMIPASGQVVW